MERDNWMCQACESKTETLNVHHVIYLKGKKPWEVPNGFLITLCEPCHLNEKNESGYFPLIIDYISVLLDTLWEQGFTYLDLNEIGSAFYSIPPKKPNTLLVDLTVKPTWKVIK